MYDLVCIRLSFVLQQGYTALHRAVVMKQYTLCQQLVSKGVDINTKTWVSTWAVGTVVCRTLVARHGSVYDTCSLAR